MYAAMIIFFLANAVEGQLISTGAFEVELNGTVNIFIMHTVVFRPRLRGGFPARAEFQLG